LKSVLNDVITAFCFNGQFTSAEPLNFGNINDTYILTFKGSEDEVYQYILQRINHNVFKEPDNLMKNVISITRHIQEKVIKQG
jgi:hypothetical protein